MDKFAFTVWYDGYKDLSNLYDLFEKYDFFKPKEMYVNETNDSPNYRNKMDAHEIKEWFDEVCKKSDNVITVGGYGFSLLIAPTVTLGDYYCVMFDIAPRVLKKDYVGLEKLFKEVAEFTGAFYGIIDTINNKGEIFEKEKEDVYRPAEYIQALFWGNYFGEGYAEHSNILKMANSKNVIAEKVGNGRFIKFSEYVSECTTEDVRKKRKKLRKYIKSFIGIHHIRYEKADVH